MDKVMISQGPFLLSVMPAQAGIPFSFNESSWIPAFAGMTDLLIKDVLELFT